MGIAAVAVIGGLCLVILCFGTIVDITWGHREVNPMAPRHFLRGRFDTPLAATELACSATLPDSHREEVVC